MHIELTEKEENFLKQYAAVYENERSLDITRDPIIVVEVEKEIVSRDGYQDKYVYVWNDDTYDSFEGLEVELLDCNYDNDDIDNIKDDLDEHGKAAADRGYIQRIPVTIIYSPVAYFLTRAEAEKYCKYQGHNLRRPRVYSRYVGYDNKGDMAVLMQLLLKVGQSLLGDNNA